MLIFAGKNMAFYKTPFEGLLVFEPRRFEDERGYFYESYNRRLFEENGIHSEFVQDNQAFSSRGVLRGLHFQRPPYAQAKLVRVAQGEVLDVVVDLRREQPTFGKWFAICLSEENHKQLYVPRGFAHGYLVLSPKALFLYKCDNYYAPEYEAGIRYDDSQLNIQWEFPADQMIISEKDRNLPSFEELNARAYGF